MYLALGIVFIKKEYQEKKEVGYYFAKRDFKATNKNLLIIIFITFLGSFMASFSGVSPAIIFGPTLIYLDVEA
jgi:hypothetical protein